MKKYLMSGIAVIAFAAAFTSCSKSTDLYDQGAVDERNRQEQEKKEEAVKSDFNALFLARFNTSADAIKNHHWGFAEEKVPTGYPAPSGSTRGHNVNRNEWGTGNGIGGNVVVPKNVNDPTVNANERTLVYNYFNKKRENAVNENNVFWTDFFITEVWKGEDSYYDYNQYNWTEAAGQDPVRGELKADAVKNVLGSDHMDHLQVKYADGDLLPPNNACWEHANDFNNANHNSSYGTIEGHTFMNNSGTLDFAYLNSTDSKYHNEYIIIPGAVIDPSLADYYYVGFDFCAYKGYVQEDSGVLQQKDGCVDRDWVFTDWIVRISPAEFKNSHRIIAEDLSADDVRSDFDYNDVVFDVALSNDYIADLGNKLVAHCTLQAAGGTMPLYIGGKENGKEVHALFGVPTSVMVNTNNGTASKAPVQFTIILGDADWSNSYNVGNIPVVVDGKAGTLTLKSEVGKAPEKICVGTDYKWCDERQPVDEKYPNFVNWVSNENFNWYR